MGLEDSMTVSASVSGSGTLPTFADPAAIVDNDDLTHYGVVAQYPMSMGGMIAIVEAVLELPEGKIDATTINFVASAYGSGSYRKLEYFKHDAWIEAAMFVDDYEAGKTVAINTENVTKIRLTCRGVAYQATATYARLIAAISEITVNGTIIVTKPSGIFVKGAQGVVQLAEEESLSGPLRFYRDGSVRSLMLVPLTDEDASPMRVKKGNGVFAVAVHS